MAYRINPRWIDIPEEQIYQNLLRAGVSNWGIVTTTDSPYPKHYLIGGRHAYPYSLPADVIDRLSRRLNEVEHMTWHNDYNAQAIAYFDEHNQALNQALAYWQAIGDTSLPKPEILPINSINEGRDYIAIIGLFHLTGAENHNNHHLYIDLLDEQGNRIYDHTPPLYLYYRWEGMTTDEMRDAQPVRIDKPPNEPGANIEIGWGQVIYGFYINNIAVDRFRGVHIRYPNDGEGNNQGHHSHYVVLQKRKYKSIPDPEPPDPEPPDPEPEPPEPDDVVLIIKKSWLDSLPVGEDGFIRVTDE